MSEGPPPRAVLFACAMNAVRSPMAAALMKHLFPRGVYVASAGVHRGEPDPFAVTVMDEIGLDISKHQPRTFADLNDSSFDLVVTLAPEAHHHALELTRTMAMDVEYWPTPSPVDASGSRDQILDAYRALRESLLARIKRRFAWTPMQAG